MNEELRAELLRRGEVDQSVRTADEKDVDRMKVVDADNTNYVRKVIASHGWPGKSMVGEDGASAAWLLVQHAPLDLQEQCLPLLEQAVEDGEANKIHWAYLLDRVRMRQGEPQLFGTQFIRHGNGSLVVHPIEDEEKVDERRAALGLEPLADYANRFTT